MFFTETEINKCLRTDLLLCIWCSLKLCQTAFAQLLGLNNNHGPMGIWEFSDTYLFISKLAKRGQTCPNFIYENIYTDNHFTSLYVLTYFALFHCFGHLFFVEVM